MINPEESLQAFVRPRRCGTTGGGVVLFVYRLHPPTIHECDAPCGEEILRVALDTQGWDTIDLAPPSMPGILLAEQLLRYGYARHPHVDVAATNTASGWRQHSTEGAPRWKLPVVRLESDTPVRRVRPEPPAGPAVTGVKPGWIPLYAHAASCPRFTHTGPCNCAVSDYTTPEARNYSGGDLPVPEDAILTVDTALGQEQWSGTRWNAYVGKCRADGTQIAVQPLDIATEPDPGV